MALDDPTAIHSTRPTIEVGGMSYPLLNANIQAIRVHEALGGLTTMELTVIDWVTRSDGSSGHGADAGSPLLLGVGVRVFLGAAAVMASEIFDGQIIAIEAETTRDGPPRLTVIAEDRLFSARRKRQSRILADKSPAQIATQIANDHNLTPQVRAGLESPFADWVQQDESDLAFLRRILSRFDADVQIVGNMLQVGRVGVDQRSAVTLVAGSSLESVRIIADAAHQINDAKLCSYDPLTGETLTGAALAVGTGPGAGKTGAEILSANFAALSQPLGHFGPMDQAEADAVAVAECAKRARAFVQATGTAIGNAQLRVGSWVTLAGVNANFANVYSVVQATHRYDATHGYRTDFVAQCAYMAIAA
jgi:uncharacterized protein